MGCFWAGSQKRFTSWNKKELFLFYIKKNKISKIYAVFGNFQKWVPAAPPPLGDRPLAWACCPSRGRQGPVCNKNIYNQTSGDLFVIKIFTCRLGGPVARSTGDRGGRSPPPHQARGLRVVVSWSSCLVRSLARCSSSV